MKISRRSFLKWCTASAAALGLTKLEVSKLESVVMAAETNPPVIWLQGSNCSGCSISLLNSIQETTIDDLITNKISMKYHHNLMTAAGDLAISAIDDTVAQYDGQFILVVEGAVPTADNGIYCVLTEKNGQPWTMLDAINELAPKASYVISAGTCASFGGVPMAAPNPTGCMPVNQVVSSSQLNNPIINLPGCPVHPYTITKTIIDLLLYGLPTLDLDGRPLAFYQSKIHSNCPRRGTGRARELGSTTGCFSSLGCQGSTGQYDCPSRKWNNQQNWCIESGHTCIACSDKVFPQTPFYNF